MRKLIATVAVLAALLPSLAAAQPPQTLPANTVLGRLGIGTGPAQAIPFATLSAQLTLSNAVTSIGGMSGAISCGANLVCSGGSISVLSSVAQGDLLYGSAAGVISELAKDANATRYLSNTGASNNPAWAQINLANGVTNNLPIANLAGGTGAGATTFLRGDNSWNQITSAALNITATACSNQFVTAIAATGVGSCTTAALAGAQFANQGTTTTLLHGNAAGSPSWSAVSLTADVSGILPIANGGTALASGTSGGVLAFTASGTLASSGALTANNPVIGGGAGVAPSSGTRSGNTTVFATVTGSFTDGHCLQITSGNVVDAGGACTTGGGGGTVTAGTAGQLAYYASSSTTITGNANVTVSAGAVTHGQTGSVLGSLILAGNTSGAVTIQPQAAAGTYNFNLPTAAGTSGQPLLSGGGGAGAQTYGTLGVAAGGTGLTTGTSGGILGFTASGTLASSGALTASAIVLGGGAGATPTALGSLGTTTTLLHGNAAGAPTFGAVVSADLNITTSTCTNQFVSAISAGGVGTCTSDTLASAQHANEGTTTTVLHGNGAGNPSWGAVSLTADVTNTLPVANGGTGLTSGTSGGILAFTASGTLASSSALTANAVVLGGGAGVAPTAIASLGTAGQALFSQGAGSPPVFASGPGKLLNTLTASSSATLDDTTSFTSAFNEYELVFENLIPVTNGQPFALLVHSGGAFQTTSYVWSAIVNPVGNAVTGGSTVTTSISPQFGVSNAAANGGMSGHAIIHTPSGTASPKAWTGQFLLGTGSGTLDTGTFSGHWNNTAAVDGFQFKYAAGITSGIIKVYGRL